MQRPSPTKTERSFPESEIIVSKADTKGCITYVNDVFCKVGLYHEKDVLGQPHSILRHPDMPCAVFHLLWERIQSGREVFAYVKNLAKNGDYYWVLDHVTPSENLNGRVDGYHSNRRAPDREAITQIEPLYARLLAEESRHSDRAQGVQASLSLLENILQEQGRGYDEFVLDLATRNN